LLKLTAPVWTVWLDEKNARGLLSFDDMIRSAAEAISLNEAYASRFAQIMVDEFQDTNGLQADLVRSLHESGKGGLFIVGDLQQSIYRFRHAQPELFWKWLSRPEEEVERITLDVTFRSRQAVMNNINGLFSRLWSDGVASGTPQPYTPLTPPEERDWWPERQNGSLEPFHIIVSANDPQNPDGKKLKAQGVRENLFRHVASRISKTVEKGCTIWAEDGSGGYGLRPVTYGDVTVLVPSRSQYEAIEKVFLEEWNIPLAFESNRDFYSRSEVRDIGSLLNMLAGSPDETTLASWLLSPLSGVSPDEAMNILTDRRDDSGKPKSIAEALGDTRPDIVARMEELRKKALTEGPASALGRLLQDVSAVAAHPSWRRLRAAANIRRAIDLAREYENTAGGNLAGCAAWIRNTIRSGNPSAEAGALDDGDDMVRVMTIHAAKGLEFPVTILAGLEHRPKTRPPSVNLAPSPVFGAVFTSFPQGCGDEKPLAPQIHDAMDLFDALEEQERLLYVACTRAKDSLVLCAAGGETDDENGVSFPRRSCMERLAETLDIPAVSPPPEPPNRSRNHQPEQSSPPDAFLPHTPRRGLTRISATSWALMRYCPYAFRMRHRQGMEIAWESPAGDGHGGPDLGSLAHWILKHWDLDPATLVEWLPGETGSEKTASVLPVHLRPVWRDENRTAMLREWLEHFADSPTAEAMRLSEHLEREAPFRIAVRDQLFLVGSIDALWRDGGEICMTDYKITLENNAPEGLYEDQLTAYALAIRERFGDIPIRASLCMLRESVDRPVEIRNDMERVKTEIAEAAEKAVTGPFGPSPERCPACPWKRSCAAAVLA
ncbi:MAG: 3'-5' exonuclease, partial [Synergistota bacterium]|nr:3'-5' exonuclease [Synergistota bacterium]